MYAGPSAKVNKTDDVDLGVSVLTVIVLNCRLINKEYHIGYLNNFPVNFKELNLKYNCIEKAKIQNMENIYCANSN